VDEEFFDRLPEMTEEEEDMLDLAWGLEDNSRLGCQIKMVPELNGLKVTIPDE
jgi:ferredoxin